MKSLRIGFLGAGQWGVIKHLPSIIEINRSPEYGFQLELTHLLELNEEHREAITQKFGFKKSSGDFEAWISDDDIDVFMVMINPARLKDVLPRIIQTGKPFLCEKPSAENYVDGLKYASLVHQCHVIAFNRRFHPLVVDLRKRLQGLKIHCFQAHMLRHGRLDSYRHREDHNAPPFFRVTGIHLIDVLNSLIGDLEIDQVIAMETEPGQNDGRFVHCSRGMIHGQIAILPTCGRDEEMIEIHTPQFSFKLVLYVNGREDSSLLIYENGQLVETIKSDLKTSHLVRDGYIGEHLAFYEAVLSGTTSISTLDSAAHSLKLAEQIEQGD